MFDFFQQKYWLSNSLTQNQNIPLNIRANRNLKISTKFRVILEISEYSHQFIRQALDNKKSHERQPIIWKPKSVFMIQKTKGNYHKIQKKNMKRFPMKMFWFITTTYLLNRYKLWADSIIWQANVRRTRVIVRK